MIKKIFDQIEIKKVLETLDNKKVVSQINKLKLPEYLLWMANSNIEIDKDNFYLKNDVGCNVITCKYIEVASIEIDSEIESIKINIKDKDETIITISKAASKPEEI